MKIISNDALMLEAIFHDVWLNVMKLYIEHLLARYERRCLPSRRAEVLVTLMRRDCPTCRVWVSLYLLVFEHILPIWGSSRVRLPKYAVWVTLAGNSTAFHCGADFVKVKVPIERMRPASKYEIQ